MAVVRNNSVGELSTSSSQVARAYRIDTSVSGRSFTSEPLYVQGMKHIAIQVEAPATNVNHVTIQLYGSVSQEGANPEFFQVRAYTLATGIGAVFIFDSLILPVQFIRVFSYIDIGTPDVLYRVRMMSSQ
jgi:hypothetical protein